MISVVQKPFEGPAGTLASGTVIDTSTWRNEERLHNCRFLRQATETEAAALRGAAPARPSMSRSATPTKRKGKGKVH